MPAQFETGLNLTTTTKIWGMGVTIGPEEVALMLLGFFVLIIAFYLVRSLRR